LSDVFDACKSRREVRGKSLEFIARLHREWLVLPLWTGRRKLDTESES